MEGAVLQWPVLSLLSASKEWFAVMSLPLPAEVSARVIAQIDRLRDAHRRAMQWDWCGTEPPPLRPSLSFTPTEIEFDEYKAKLAASPFLPSCRTHSPDGKAFMFIAHAEALSTFLVTGDIAKAVATGRREWSDYVATHNRRIKERGWDQKQFVGFTNDVPCRDDQWGDADDDEVIFWCSTDAERDSRRVCDAVERKHHREDAIGVEDYLSDTETRVELDGRDAVVYAVSRDYLRRIYGARDSECGGDAVWAVAKDTHHGTVTHKGIQSRYFCHLYWTGAWEFDGSLEELVDFALAHTTPAMRRISVEGIDALFDAYHAWRCESA
jgi:hypothetical protein